MMLTRLCLEQQKALHLAMIALKVCPMDRMKDETRDVLLEDDLLVESQGEA